MMLEKLQVSMVREFGTDASQEFVDSPTLSLLWMSQRSSMFYLQVPRIVNIRQQSATDIDLVSLQLKGLSR